MQRVRQAACDVVSHGLSGMRLAAARSPWHRPLRVGAPGALQENPMSVAKVIEITAESEKSFEDAIQRGIAAATESVHQVRSAWVKEQQVLVADNKVRGYRVDLKVTFVVEKRG
jgi:dodecin